MARIACLLGRHRWSSTENRATQGYDFRCLRCGRERHTYPGDPAFRASPRVPDSSGEVSGLGGGA